MNTEVRGMQNPIGSTILRGRAAIEEVQALLTQLVQHDKDLANVKDTVSHGPYELEGDLVISQDEVLAVIQARRDSVVRLLENKGLQVRPDVDVYLPMPQVEYTGGDNLNDKGACDPVGHPTDPLRREL